MDLLLKLLKMLDVEKLLNGLLDELLFPALDKLVASTDNTLDDALAGLVKQALKTAVKDLVEKLPK